MPSSKSLPAKTRVKFAGHGKGLRVGGVTREARPRPLHSREVQRAAAHIVYDDSARTIADPTSYYAEEKIRLAGNNVLDYWYMTDPEYWAKVRPGGKKGKMPAHVERQKKKQPAARPVECLSVMDLEARWQDALMNHVGLKGAREGRPPAAGTEDYKEAETAIHQFVAISDAADDNSADTSVDMEAVAQSVAAAAKVQMKIPSVMQEAGRREAESPGPIMH